MSKNPTTQQLSAALFESASAFMTATASTRVNNGIPFLMAAARFSRAVKAVEDANRSEPFGEFWEEIRSNAVACILLVAAALESYTNELFSDRDKVFADQKMRVLEKLWKTFERKPSVEKFNMALLLRDKPEIDEKSDTYRAISAVLKLRNALTHFSPEWSHAPNKHQKLSKELEGYFSPSAILKGEQFIFPMAWAGHSCTSWAVQTAIKFIQDFEVLADLPDRTNWKAFYDRLQP